MGELGGQGDLLSLGSAVLSLAGVLGCAGLCFAMFSCPVLALCHYVVLCYIVLLCYTAAHYGMLSCVTFHFYVCYIVLGSCSHPMRQIPILQVCKVRLRDGGIPYPRSLIQSQFAEHRDLLLVPSSPELVPVCFLSPLQPQAKARKPRAKSKSKTDLLRKCIEDKIQLFDAPAPEDLLEKVRASPRLWHLAGPAAVRRAHEALGCGCLSPPNTQILNRHGWTRPSRTPLHRLLLSGTFFLRLCTRRSPGHPQAPPAAVPAARGCSHLGAWP